MSAKHVASLEDEKQLLARAQKGDNAALEALLSHYQHLVFNVCLRMVSQRDDAAELTQDVLLKLCTHLEGFQQQSSLKTWVTRIAMNASISHLRKRKLRTTTSLESPMGGGTTPGATDQATELKQIIAETREPTPGQRVSKEEQIEHLMQRLEALDEDLKSVLVLRDLQGQDYQQIAETLEIPVGTVKSRLFRARAALREAMEQKGYRHAI